MGGWSGCFDWWVGWLVGFIWLVGWVGVWAVFTLKCARHWKFNAGACCQELDEDYRHSMKKGMLDYVLLDEEEQERLGVTVLPKVRWRNLKCWASLVYSFITKASWCKNQRSSNCDLIVIMTSFSRAVFIVPAIYWYKSPLHIKPKWHSRFHHNAQSIAMQQRQQHKQIHESAFSESWVTVKLDILASKHPVYSVERDWMG